LSAENLDFKPQKHLNFDHLTSPADIGLEIRSQLDLAKEEI